MNIKQLWREHGVLLILTSAIILLQMLAGVALWDRLPDQIATHFDLEGTPNGWSSKAFTVFGMPLILLALHWVCLLGGGRNLRTHGKKLHVVLLMVIPAVSILVSVTCYGYALDQQLDTVRAPLIFVGLVFAVTGNYLPKLRRNYTAGIKLPWTMADEENWNRTHRMAAPIWVVCGLVILAVGLLGEHTWIAGAAIAAAALLPTAYSLMLHMKKKNQ